MATLKLLSTPDHLDGSHRIGSPGGYEFWQFHAEDPERRLRIAAGFHDGFGLHPEYIRRYAAYRRKPTRNAPPTPPQFPCLTMGVFENEKRVAGSTIFFPARSFQAENGSLVLESNRAIFRKEDILLTLAVREQATSVELCFQPSLSMTTSHEESFPADEHRWIPARPLCGVHGRISVRGRTFSFAGLGQHNHYYGTRPMFPAANRWIRGSVLFPLAAEVFQVIDERALAISVDESGLRPSENAPFTAKWKKPLFGRRSYPLKMEFGDRLILRNPRVATSIAAQLQLIYDAYVDGEQATAWVEMDCK